MMSKERNQPKIKVFMPGKEINPVDECPIALKKAQNRIKRLERDLKTANHRIDKLKKQKQKLLDKINKKNAVKKPSFQSSFFQ